MKNYIGKQSNELVFQELNRDGTIRGFNEYYPVELHDGTLVLSTSFWCHEVELDTGAVLKSGMTAAPTLELPDDLKNSYFCHTVTCVECRAAHDCEDNNSWTIINECEAICKSCMTAEDALKLVEKPEDIFKSKDVRMTDLTGYTEVETLFCDSSGFGSVGEPALTRGQAIETMEQILNKSKVELYSGVTGIGQFQVYLTLFKKNKKRVRKTKSKKTA